MNDEKQHGILGSIFNWVQHPFNSQGTAFNWILFIGFIIVVVWMWNWILINLIEE